MLLKALGATVLFGSVPACIRVMDMDSYALGMWRLSLAAVGMTVVLMAQGRSLRTIAAEVRKDWKVLTAVGVFFGLHWLTYFQPTFPIWTEPEADPDSKSLLL